MFGFSKSARVDEQEECACLSEMSEKELLIEILKELKRIEWQCADVGRKVVLWSN